MAQGTSCSPRFSPRVYWAMVRDLLDESVAFAVTLRAAPYEALDERGRQLLLEAAGQLVESAACVLDAVECDVGPSAATNVRQHPCMHRLRAFAAAARIRLADCRIEIDATMAGAPVWRLADAVSDARVETIRALEGIADCYGPPRETQRRFRAYWDEHSHYASLASRATRRLARALIDLAEVRPVDDRLRKLQAALAHHVESFEFGLLRQGNRRELHGLLERLQDVQCGLTDELAQRRLWNECSALVRRVSEDQSARAV